MRVDPPSMFPTLTIKRSFLPLPRNHPEACNHLIFVFFLLFAACYLLMRFRYPFGFSFCWILLPCLDTPEITGFKKGEKKKNLVRWLTMYLFLSFCCSPEVGIPRCGEEGKVRSRGCVGRPFHLFSPCTVSKKGSGHMEEARRWMCTGPKYIE